MAGESFKDVVINERTFRFKRFSAQDGSFIALKVSSILAPMFRKVDLKSLKGVEKPEDVDVSGIDIFGMVGELSNLSEKDFNYIQTKCLRVTGEMLPGGFTSVLNDNGSFGVMNLEYDTLTVMALTAHSLIFNLSGFFSGSGLSGLLTGLLPTSPSI